MMRFAPLLLLALSPNLAFAQAAPPIVFDANSISPQGKEITVSASADRGCFLGAPSATGFSLGTIIDQSGVNAGRLRPGLASGPVTLPDSWCNFPDNALTVRATPLSAQGVSVTPPSGFARLVNFRVSANNWLRTGAPIIVATNGSATAISDGGEASGQGQEGQYRVADIVLSLDQFSVPGTTLGRSPLMVAAATYQGSVVVLLGPAVLASAIPVSPIPLSQGN
jgi:hypothetical protein